MNAKKKSVEPVEVTSFSVVNVGKGIEVTIDGDARVFSGEQAAAFRGLVDGALMNVVR